MDTNIIKVAYLNRISTKKDGKSSIYSRTLHEVLEEQHAMEKPEDKVFEDEMSARNYKSLNPGIFPIALPYESAAYTNDVFKYGHTVLVDIDTTELADEVFSRADEMKAMIPSLVAVWFSLRNKLHFAFLRPWAEPIEHAAYWKLLSDELIRCVGEMFGRDAADSWRKHNDTSLSTCKHLMSAGYTKNFKWYDEADTFEVDLEMREEAVKRYEYRRIQSVTPQPYSLFRDEEVKKQWRKCNFVKKFVAWCEKNRNYKCHTQDKEYDYKVESVDGVQYNVWRNDGTVHILKTCGGFRMADYRKRHITAAAVMAACLCNASFEEALYSTAKYYVENCYEYDARDFEKDIILPRVESAFANKERNLKMIASTGYLLEERQVVIAPITPDGYSVSRSEGATVRSAVKRSDRQARFLELYEQGDTTAVMTMKLRANGYPRITEHVTYKVACECGIKLDKPANKYRGRYDYKESNKGKYKNAYNRDGKRTMVRVEDIDNVTWFASKKALEEYMSRETDEWLAQNTDEEWLKEIGLD